LVYKYVHVKDLDIMSSFMDGVKLTGSLEGGCRTFVAAWINLRVFADVPYETSLSQRQQRNGRKKGKKHWEKDR